MDLLFCDLSMGVISLANEVPLLPAEQTTPEERRMAVGRLEEYESGLSDWAWQELGRIDEAVEVAEGLSD